MGISMRSCYVRKSRYYTYILVSEMDLYAYIRTKGRYVHEYRVLVSYLYLVSIYVYLSK